MNAFQNNRECGLYIMDEGVTSFYLGEYMEDWNHDYKSGDTLTVVPVMPSVEDGPVSFTVKGVVGGCEWKIITEDGEESRSTEGSTLSLESSANLKYVLVKDSNDNTGRFIFKGAIVEDDGFDIPVKTIAIAGATGAGVLGFIILMLRRILSR